MTKVTLQPNTTDYFEGAISRTGASYHGVLSDGYESTHYVEFGSGQYAYVAVGLTTVDLPDGALVKRAAIRLYGGGLSSGPLTVVLFGRTTTAYIQWGSNIVWTVATLELAADGPAAIDNADLAAAYLQFAHSGPGALRLLEAWVDVTYVERPQVSITSPTDLVDDTNIPTIKWAVELDADGGQQTHYLVSIQNSSGEFVDGTLFTGSAESITEIASSATSWTGTRALDDGDYTATVVVQQTVSGVRHHSEAASMPFTIAVDRPPSPVLTVTPRKNSGWFEVVTEPQAEGPDDATTDMFEIQRAGLDGEWHPIRVVRADGLVSPDEAQNVVDWEAPFSQVVTYRARALHNYSGIYAASEWTETVGVLDTGWWLRHPTNGRLAMPVEIHAFPSVKRAARQGVHQPLGRRAPIVVSDVRTSATGTFTLRLDNDEQRARLDELLDSLSPLLLQGPPGQGWTPAYVSLGDLDRTRFADKAFVRETTDAIPFTVVDRPASTIAGWPA